MGDHGQDDLTISRIMLGTVLLLRPSEMHSVLVN